jgi:hypothetical protein
MANYRPTHLPGHTQQVPVELERELSGTERLLWWGRPLAGMRLRGSDVVGIPFSLMWGGFAIFWEAMAIRSGAPFFFKLWGIPFVAVGLYLIAGRFLYDAWRRSRTAYAVTNERVILQSGGVRPSVLSLRLATIPALSLTEGRGGVGTISFGGGAGIASFLGGMQGWPGAAKYVGPQFDLVPNVRSVYETIQAAQRDVTSNQARVP